MVKFILLIIIIITKCLYANFGSLTDLVCNGDTEKEYYYSYIGEWSGWRVVQLLPPYIVIRFWNCNNWSDCHSCLVKVKKEYWDSGEWKVLESMDWVPEMKFKYIGIQYMSVNGFNVDYPLIQRME